MHIPGFEIERAIGRGGMAQVYLAVQTKFGRHVALKIVSEQFAKDPKFRTRFLSESRINAQLNHPNIVQVYDVGESGPYLYLVMEYLAGGDLNRRLHKGIELKTLIGVVADIGSALDYAHSKGFVHRDIKPENIVFRAEGSAVLTDFGIARYADASSSVTRTGTVVGTPQYMSPEQASGQELDGRSDLYSLGVVFYKMLTGDVPYKAETAVAVGIKHLTEPVPKLPSHLSAFQATIDRCLAKEPKDRYQTGAELSSALRKLRDQPFVPDGTIRSNAVTTQEIRAVGTTMLTTIPDSVRADRDRRAPRRKRRMGLSVGLTLLIGLMAGSTWLFVERPEWINDNLVRFQLADDDSTERLWHAAQSLRQDPNQSLAAVVAGYRRVLDVQPDHPGANSAIDGLASQWKEDIRLSLFEGALAVAENKLAESRQVFPDDPQIQELEVQLNNRQTAENLLLSTQALLRTHGLSDIPSATAAIQAYQEVLRLSPENLIARAELDSLATHYADMARTAIDDGNVEDAISFLDRASAANPELTDLTAVRARIGRETDSRTKIDEILNDANEYLATGAFINPPGENAAELYHRVLATDPNNVVARQGLGEVVSQFNKTTSQLLATGMFEAADALVARATAVGLDSASVNQVKARLDQESARISSVESMLEQAAELLRQGYVTEPPVSNAVSTLREVERLDPDNDAAQLMLNQAAEMLASAAIEAHDAELVTEAKHYMDLALAVRPGAAQWRDLRQKWNRNPE